MTSSWLLQQRKKMGVWDIQNFGNPNNALGGWEDHYITPGHTHECHPDFEAIPIGNPYGFMVCKKRKHPDGTNLDLPYKPTDLSLYNGYHKFQADMYSPCGVLPRQISNPEYYYNRVIPNEIEFHKDDYIARGINYNGTGIKPVHTPGTRKYNEYGFDYTPIPPYKYDVQHLHQPYNVWRDEQKFKGMSEEQLDEIDKTYTDSSPYGFW